MSVIQNKEDMISYYQLKKNWKKVEEAQILGDKFDDKLVLFAF